VSRYVIQRSLQAIAICFGAATLTFLLLRLSSDPAAQFLPPHATAEDIRLMRDSMGLNDPLYVQYGRFLLGIAHADLGNSFWIPQPAIGMILDRLPATLSLALAGLILSVVVGVGLGIVSATRPYSLLDHLATIFAVGGQSLPLFWLGLMLILVFSVNLRWLPASGVGDWRHLIMPAVTLGLYQAPLLMRLTRSGMLEVLGQDYVRTAHAKGLPEPAVVWWHAFRNASIPIATLIGVQFGRLLGGSIVTETVFAWPGVASLTVQSINTSDYPVVQAAVLLLAGTVVVANLIADLVVAFLDPRIRYA
jgi:peptide/nickel transport system permease protein